MTCPYCDVEMANPRRVQCGAPDCARKHNAERSRGHVAAWREREKAAGRTGQSPPVSRTCVVCDKAFETRKRDAKYCSTGRDSCEASARSVEYRTREDIVQRIVTQNAARAATKRGNAAARSICGEPSHGATLAYLKALRQDPCAYCGEPAEALDHVEPSADGGADGWDNRAASCHMCNSYKGRLPLLQALLFVPAAREYHTLRRALLAPAA